MRACSRCRLPSFRLHLAYGRTLRLLPPLNIDEADLENFAEALEETLKETM